MAKPEWGVKRTCLSCATRFYDFRRDPIICPNCEARFLPDAALKPRRARVAADPAKVVPKPAPVAPAPESEPPGEDPVKAGETSETEEIEKELAEITKGGEAEEKVADDDADEAVIEDTTDLGGDDDGGLGEVRENIDKPDAS
ncbi:MAG: TIGR02300 family protein [Alphaproteobacteria bacterium]|nr:TIGR02300 family protein [Alphaproteobacteria bacterium]